MANRDELPGIVSQSLREGLSTEAILELLRSKGATKIDCIRALHDGARMSLADAKRAVHFSAAWADTKERDEKFRDELEAALKDFP